MTSSITGKVVIDDTDSLIHYVGPWITANGQNYDTQRDFGVTFNNSLHGTTGVANFSFSLVVSNLQRHLRAHSSAVQGSQVYVYGTISIINSTGVADPSWGCFMDSVASGTSPPFGHIENNRPLCGIISPMDHISWKFTSPAKDRPFGSIKSIILPLPISSSTRRLFWLIIRMPIFTWTRHGRI